VTTKDLWKAYRASANEKSFVRVVKNNADYRVPEPKILAGSIMRISVLILMKATVTSFRCAPSTSYERRGRHGGSVHETDDGLG